MIFWCGVAGGTICQARVVNDGVLPVGGGVAVGTLPRPMAAGRRVARLAIISARVAEDDLRPVVGGVATCALPSVMSGLRRVAALAIV